MTPADISRLTGYIPGLASALAITVSTALLAMFLSTTIGILVAIALVAKQPALRRLASTYVELFRTIPELVQVYGWFYFLPALGLVLDPIAAGVIALAIAFGPYLAEVFRAGIVAIDRTQWEAAQVLGMSRMIVWWRVILPQAFRTVLPVWTGYFITMYKATSLLSFITVVELFGFARFEAALTFRYFELFGIVLVLYLAVGIPTVYVLHWLERHLAAVAPRPIREDLRIAVL